MEHYIVKSKTINVAGIEMTCELRTKDATTTFVNRIHDISNVESATLVSYAMLLLHFRMENDLQKGKFLIVK